MGMLEEEPTSSEEEELEGIEIGDANSESSASESESEEEGDVKLAEPSKDAIYNRDAILDKLGDIAWPENIDWIHKLSFEVDQGKEVDVEDDLARELSFYTQALEGSRGVYEKLQSIGLPFLRPSDYYAQMVKSDVHMEKVKGRLLAEKRKLEEAEERRKAREAKRIAKEVQAQKLKERAKRKREDIESVKQWRKKRQQSGFASGDKGGDVEFPFEDESSIKPSKKRLGMAPGDRSGGRGKQFGKGKQGMQKKMNKRDSRDSKYGFGGRKALRKQNTADTTNDFKGFNQGFRNKKKK